MKRLFLTVLTFVILMTGTAQVHGQEIAGQSAVIASNSADVPIALAKQSDFAKKKMAIKRVLERYNSPVVDTVDGFIAACQEYDLNCYLLPAIMGVESGFGRAYIPGTYNGHGWASGTITFSSWEDGYMTIGKALREKYIDRGATDVYSIGKIYAGSETWPQKVSFFMSQFEAEEANLALYFE